MPETVRTLRELQAEEQFGLRLLVAFILPQQPKSADLTISFS
jgi:hypothetical protein